MSDSPLSWSIASKLKHRNGFLTLFWKEGGGGGFGGFFLFLYMYVSLTPPALSGLTRYMKVRLGAWSKPIKLRITIFLHIFTCNLSFFEEHFRCCVLFTSSTVHTTCYPHTSCYRFFLILSLLINLIFRHSYFHISELSFRRLDLVPSLLWLWWNIL